MILILSQEKESSTDSVIDYLVFSRLNIPFLRVNAIDLVLSSLKVIIGENFFLYKGEKVYYTDIKVVWFRRWFDLSLLENKLNFGNNNYLKQQFLKLIKSEFKVLFGFFYNKLQNAYWLSRPEDDDINKLLVLETAKSVGLKIPKTIITTRKKYLPKIKENISKPLGSSFQFDFEENKEFTFYTDKFCYKSTTDKFFPSLTQKYIDKEYEIRSFFLDTKIYSVAIFSQSNDKTKVDMRHYDYKNPNYNTKFSLPKSIEKKIFMLMKKLKLTTGSIDLIKSKKNNYVFLEVNPIGQFGYLSSQGNYNLEKKIAHFLIKKYNEKKI